jgi:phosphoribosylformylglycinamidine synthase subunit PurL
VAVSIDCNARFAQLDPYAGAQLALAEAYRNVAVTGATPLAVTNCLNFGSPEDPLVMWHFREAVRGLADGCEELEIPVTGGNVSFYNQTGSQPILPTPVVGVLGVLDDVSRRTPLGFAGEDRSIYLLGATRDEFGGSEWARVAHGHLGGRPPRVDLPAERRLADVLVTAAHEGLVDSAHDLSDGGLAQALAESCLRGGVGARIRLPDRADPFVMLFSESSGRAIVAVSHDHDEAFKRLCGVHNVTQQRVGATQGLGNEPVLDLAGQCKLSLGALRDAWSSTLPGLFGGTSGSVVDDHALAGVPDVS